MSRPAIAMVVPTAGRPRLAAGAVRTLLRHRADDLRVVVSDTSADPADAAWLERTLARIHDARLVYLRAPELTMGEHWDWAIERALELTAATYVGIHYDRKRFRNGGLRRLFDTVARRQSAAVSYAVDTLSLSSDGRFATWLTPHTGAEYEISSSEIVRLTAQGLIPDLGQAWPMLANCVAHRDLLSAIRARFGSYCAAIGPDAAFAYRMCVLEETSVFIDEPLAIMRAPQRSNGVGYLTGAETDFADFKRRHGAPLQAATRFPSLNLGFNVTLHDYELVRRAAPELPPVTDEGYLHALAAGLWLVGDPATRAELTAFLRAEGWTGAVDEREYAGTEVPVRRRKLLRALAEGRLRDRNALHGRAFRSEREAVWWLLRLPGPPSGDLPPDPAQGRALLDRRLG